MSAGAKAAFALLAPHFRARRFPAGSILWREGEPADLVVGIDEGDRGVTAETGPLIREEVSLAVTSGHLRLID